MTISKDNRETATSGLDTLQAKLLITSHQIQSLKTLLQQQLKVKGQTEFELRIKKINPSNRKQFLLFSDLEIRRLYHQCAKDSSKIDFIEDIVYSKSKQDDIVYRKIVYKGTTSYQTKYKPKGWILDVPFVSKLKFDISRDGDSEQKRLDPGMLPLTNVRFAKAVEGDLSEKEYQNLAKPEQVRKRQRSIYHYRPGVQVHLTKITNLNNSTDSFTEIEVEVDVQNITEARSLLMTIKPIFSLLFPSIYCYYSFEKFQSDQLFHIPSYLISSRRPVNIQERHYTPRLLNYAVTNKLDGVEYKLWFQKRSEERMDIILFNDVQVRFIQSLPFCIENDLPLFKCEVVDGIKPQIYIFDSSTSSNDVYNFFNNGPLVQRLSEAHRIVDFVVEEMKKRNLNMDFSLSVKHFEFLKSYDSSGLVLAIRQLTEYMVREFGLNQIEDANDGIIFEPIESNLHLDTLKWKFPSKVTIDLQMKKRQGTSFQTPGDSYDLIVRNGTVFNFLAPGSTSNRLQDRTYATVSFSPSQTVFGMDSSQLSGLIGEFGYDMKTSSFILHRIRWDKEFPNAYKVVEETFHDILYVKTLPHVLSQIKKIESFEGSIVSFQKISETYRKKANAIKDHLIQQHCSNRKVLDIGSGRGGDVQKYEKAHTNQLYFVEPNRKFLQSLRTRIQELGSHTFNSTVIQCGGEDTQTILQHVQPQSIDVIAMMQSLTYFFQTEEMLDRLIQTISTCLTPNGSFIGVVMRGEKVYDYLYENDFYIKRNSYSIHLEGILDPHAGSKSPSVGKIITTHLQGTETAEQITEGLVYLSVLSERLDPYNLTLTECQPFCESAPFLLDSSIIEKELIRMKAFYHVEKEVVTLFGEVARTKLRMFLLGAIPTEDPIVLQNSKYGNREYNIANLPTTELNERSQTFQDLVLSIFQEYTSQLQETLPIDKDLIIKDGKITYSTNELISFPIQSVPLIKSTTLLDKHYFASALRYSYFGSIQPYHFDFAKAGYGKQDSVLEAFGSSDRHYFTYFCSPFSDVHPGSLGRFEEIRRWKTEIVYIIPPSKDIEYIRMLLPYITECAKYTTVVLLLPSESELLQAVELDLQGEVILSRRSYTSLLTHVETKKEIPHVEYILGVKREIHNRRVLTNTVFLNNEETRLFGLYSTFVYESVIPLEFDIDHSMANGPEIGIIVRDIGTSLLQSILMSYLGGSYYNGLDTSFEKALIDGYQFNEFINSPISLSMLLDAVEKKPNEFKEMIPNVLDAATIREDLYTGADWLKFYKNYPFNKSQLDSDTRHKNEQVKYKELQQVLICLFDLFKIDPRKHLIQMCCDRLCISIVIVHFHHISQSIDLYKGQRVDQVVFVAFDDSRYVYHPVRVLHTSRGSISQEAGLQYEWYPTRDISIPTRVQGKVNVIEKK
jgi:mRNA capping enzyme